MPKRYAPKDIEPIIAEITADNDRAKAVVAGGLLDAALDYVIGTVLVPLKDGEENQLFSLGGPFGTCDQKIQAGYSLGLYGPRTKKDMSLINSIRNYFAHNMNPCSFDDGEVASRCRELFIATNSDCHDQEMWREKFVLAIQLVVDGLLLDVAEIKRTKLSLTSIHLAD